MSNATYFNYFKGTIELIVNTKILGVISHNKIKIYIVRMENCYLPTCLKQVSYETTYLEAENATRNT